MWQEVYVTWHANKMVMLVCGRRNVDKILSKKFKPICGSTSHHHKPYLTSVTAFVKRITSKIYLSPKYLQGTPKFLIVQNIIHRKGTYWITAPPCRFSLRKLTKNVGIYNWINLRKTTRKCQMHFEPFFSHKKSGRKYIILEQGGF